MSSKDHSTRTATQGVNTTIFESEYMTNDIKKLLFYVSVGINGIYFLENKVKGVFRQVYQSKRMRKHLLR